MSLLDIYGEHHALLNRKGYDEEKLNSPNQKGWMARELLQNIGLAVKEMYIDDTPTDFSIKAVAFFEDKDMVLYQLNYKFDPQAESLRIYRLDVQWEHKRESILIANNDDLPEAKEAFEAIRDGKKIIEQKNKKVKIIPTKGSRRHL